ncbi:MAG: DUF4440 domain-containing protein [Gemmatimonadota bacterium]
MQDRGSRPAWRVEIEELHAFFEAWMGGTIPRTEEQLDRLEEALEKRFTFVTTSGQVLAREAIVGAVRESHGARPGLRIRLREPRLVHSCKHHVVATYQEWQEAEGERTGRTSTVVLERKEEAPNGLVWIHVHETWITQTS